MKLLVILLLVAVVVALPRKPSKNVPKKYNPSIHGLKDSYSYYHHAPDEDLVVPAYLDTLRPPSSYDSYSKQGPRFALTPPEGSTYIGLTGKAEGDAMLPPPVDTYSSPEGVFSTGLVPPPATPPRPDDSSYLSYAGAVEEPLVAPELSSYVQVDPNNSGHEVLASLAAMAQALPRYDSSTYNLEEGVADDTVAAPDSHLQPPSQQTHSSYAEPAQNSPLSAAQVSAADEAGIPVPPTILLPPPV